jgi:hypothetical protein
MAIAITSRDLLLTHADDPDVIDISANNLFAV